MSGDNYVKYARSDGSFWSFGINDKGEFVFAAPATVTAKLETASSLLLVFMSGEQREFDLPTGLLNWIKDRNGNTTQISWDSDKRLAEVVDPALRHLYFNYGSGANYYLVSSITSDFGLTLSYTYDTNGRLTQVTRPDQTTINYTYNSQGAITQVTDSNGKVLESHTYDSSGRGLTSSQANGVNAVTLTYP